MLEDESMIRSPFSLRRALYVLALGVIGAAAAIGLADQPERAGPAWLLLALICVVTFMGPRFVTGLLSALGAALLFVLIVLLQAGSNAGSHAVVVSLVVSAGALLVTPFLLLPISRELRHSLRQLAEQQHRIDDLTIRDEATGVYRPRFVDALLEEEIERARRYGRALTLCLVALDNWPRLVSEQGEPAMHRTLTTIERLLTSRQRMLDKVIGLGNGELALLLPETPLEGAEVVAGRIQSQIAGEAGVSLHIGLSDFPEGGATREELMREARQALDFARMANLPIVDRTLLVPS